ncbi:MAG: zinc ribbon domain-containing protein [Oscillospiraceae bacterium]|jgi:hypothetical protein|nr:zinc ribbon domain-containing protein [Oscillospiraceae bacterium]
MDLSALMGGNAPKKEQKPATEYTAQAASSLVNGEIKMTIGDNALTVTALFDAAEITFAGVNALTLTDHTVTVKADSGDIVFTRMGSWCQPFYDELCDAYNKAVLRSLFISGKPLVTAKGETFYTEKGAKGGASAAIHVYENNVTALPPDLSARRVPLCFVTGIDKDNYKLTLRLDTGESYAYTKLGYDTAPFADAVEKQIRKLREESLAAVKEIDPTLTAAQASQLARLMPQGAAASIGRLAEIAPSFSAALEDKITATRAAESYTTFRELCDPSKIWVGFRKTETAASDPYLLWLIASSPDGQHAAVEFAEADSATFVYQTGGDFDSFARQINRALEAINFKREVIRLSDEELRKPENADYHMAAKRTSALQFVRSNFAGRVIHSGAEAWKRGLTELWRAGTPAQAGSTPTRAGSKFCGQCGAAIAPGVNFCESCGAQI